MKKQQWIKFQQFDDTLGKALFLLVDSISEVGNCTDHLVVGDGIARYVTKDFEIIEATTEEVLTIACATNEEPKTQYCICDTPVGTVGCLRCGKLVKAR